MLSAALNWLFSPGSVLASNPKPAHTEAEAPRLTPEDVETLIERAGRQEVFARARQLGWGNGAPLWVWARIAHEIIDASPKRSPSPPEA